MKKSFSNAACAVLLGSMSYASAQDDTTVAEYLDLHLDAASNEDDHNADIYEKLALIKHD